MALKLPIIDTIRDLLDKVSTDSENQAQGELDEFANFCFETITRSIESGSSPDGTPFEPLSDITTHIRGVKGINHDKPLIETGDMLASVEIRRMGDKVAIGWFDDEDLMTKVLYSQFGTGKETDPFGPRLTSIPVTPKMRGFLLLEYGIPLSTFGTQVNIPPRPVIRPTAELAQRQFRNIKVGLSIET